MKAVSRVHLLHRKWNPSFYLDFSDISQNNGKTVLQTNRTAI